MGLTSDNSSPNESARGDIWFTELDPTEGDEIRKTRPVVIISADGIDSLGIKLVVPIREWKPSHENMYWYVTIEPTVRNGLAKKSSADVLQTRCVSINRFVEKIGAISAETIEDIVAALAALTEYR